MANEPILLPPGEEQPLLDLPNEQKLQHEIDDLRRQLQEERDRAKKKEDQEKAPKHPQKRTLWIIAGVLALVFILAFFLGFLPHHEREKQLEKDAEAEEKALPVLSYIYAERGSGETEIVLPGSIEAFTDSPVLARADGYLKKRYVDIGDKVNAGQLLAEIAAPDLDQQVEQGRAQLLQARASLRQAVAALEQGHANQNLARVTAVRWSALLKRGAVSPQDNDTQQANFQAQTANVGALEEAVGAAQENAKAAQANLDRLVNLQSYEKVRAPYNGVITLRNVDDGALISTAQTLLFRVAQIDRLRTYLYVPEANAHLVQVGHRASLSLAEFPGRPFTGEITRTSNSLDPMTRTLLVEVQIPNGNHALFPGMFSEVSLKQTRVNPPVLVPADALIVQPTGTFIAVLEGDAKGEREAQPEKSKEGDKKKKTSEKDDRKEKESLLKQQQELPTFTVHLAPVTVGRDYGNAIEIATGLQGNERIVPNPNDHVRENVTVKGQKSKDNPVNPAPQPGKANANGEQLAPQPNAEPVPKDPAKTRMDRGPGY